MRISDWSSDVCSSDLDAVVPALEIAGIFGQVDAEMEQRPERLVGIAVIIFVDVLLLQIDGRGLDPFILRKADLSGEILRDLARPADPDAPAFPEGLGKRDGQAALVAGLGRATDPVGNDYQAAHAKRLHAKRLIASRSTVCSRARRN